jgi:hypothetical protein
MLIPRRRFQKTKQTNIILGSTNKWQTTFTTNKQQRGNVFAQATH